MYAYIKGIISDISEDNLVLECNQIGYNINVPFSVVQQLPGVGAEVKIYTYTCVREDAFILYGFLTKDDLWIFKKLITVNGIGPKGALGILSVMSADDLRFAIIAGDSKAISKAPGIGAKSAERIILDLKDKINQQFKESFDGNQVPIGNALRGDSENEIIKQAKNEAMEAMVALGYSATDVIKALNQIEVTQNMDSGAILKQVLRIVSTM